MKGMAGNGAPVVQWTKLHGSLSLVLSIRMSRSAIKQVEKQKLLTRGMTSSDFNNKNFDKSSGSREWITA